MGISNYDRKRTRDKVMAEISYKMKKAYFKLIRACLKGNKKKQHKWEQKLIELELKRTGKI